MSDRKHQLLLVEDDDIDAMAVERVVSKTLLNVDIFRVKDGLEALELLEKQPHYPVVLLDLNMPRMNGFEFLEAVEKKLPELNLCVFVLTTSDNRLDIERCFDLGIHSYFIKEELFESPELVENISVMISTLQ